MGNLNSRVQIFGSSSPTTNTGSPIPILTRADGKVGVGGDTYVFQSDLTLDTSAYVAGDAMSDKLEITNAATFENGTGLLQEITVIDKDDQGEAFDILIFGEDLTTTTKNLAWAVSDADMEKCLGIVSVAAADYVDLGGNQIATKSNLSIGVSCKDSTSTTSLWAAAVSQGTGTYTANGIHVKFTILRD